MDEPIPQVDGLRLIARADPADGVGRGEVWRARLTGGLAGGEGARLPADLPGVGECLLRLLRMPVDEALRARAQTLASDLLQLGDPGLVGIRSVRKAYDGVALVYGHVPAPAIGLHVLARHRLLKAGEVVTLGVALCWALAHAHAAGITHGRLSDADVLLGGDGRPLLTGVGVQGVLGAPGDPDGDVRALERMLGSLLDRASAGASRVAEALGGDCPSAAVLAARLAAAGPASPIELEPAAVADHAIATPPAKRPPLKLPRVRLPKRPRPGVVAAGAGVLLLGALVGWAGAPAPHRTVGARIPAVVVPVQPSLVGHAVVDWRQVLQRLDAARAAVFAHPDPAGFDGVDVPSSPAYRYDAAAVAALRSNGVHADGLQIVLEQVAVQSIDGPHVKLRVTDRRLPYALLDARGRVVSRVVGRGSAAHLIELDAGRASNAWRFTRVTDLSPPVSS